MLLNDKIRKAFDNDLLLLVHHHADVDSVASAIGLNSIFEKSTICASDGISSHGQKLASVMNIEIMETPPEDWDGTVIVLDSPNPEHCNPVPNSESILVIDHHTKIEGWKKGTKIIHQPHRTSTAEIILDLILELNLDISKSCANALLCGIYTDTGQFRHANGETFRAASELAKIGADPQEVINILDSERPMIQKTTFLKAAQKMKWMQEGRWIIAESRVGSFESGSARLLILLGADIALVSSGNKKGDMRISTRASNRIVTEGFNLATILEEVAEINGGSAGGHPGAAGYNGKGDPEAISEITKQKCIKSMRQLA